MDNRKQVENFVQNQYGKSGIAGIVQMMQLNYGMCNEKVVVSGSGHEIKVDFQKPEAVQEYYSLRYILDNEDLLPEEQLDDAKRTVNKMKWDILSNKQSEKDRELFLGAEVYYITFSI